ncbi:MAG: hypothetical protein R3E96_02425 [Planctomycetota bacterium]
MNNAKDRNLNREMPGGAWFQNQNGCGHEPIFTKELRTGVACGMGHIPSFSRRILTYYRPEKQDR